MSNMEEKAAAKLKAEIGQAIARISTQEDAKALMHQYENINRHKSLNDFQREELIDAVEKRLRKISPSVARRIWGDEDAEARDYLQSVYCSIASKFDVLNNRVKNGVKTGRAMVIRDLFIEVYISYKNADNLSLGLVWRQEKVETSPYIVVDLRHVGADDEWLWIERFTTEDEDKGKAAELYESELSKVISS